MTGRRPANLRVVVALVVVAVVVAAACRPAARPPEHRAEASTAPNAVARGAVLYAAYCGGCHGPDGRGDGPVASFLDMKPTDLRTPGLLDHATDDAILARVVGGEPLAVSPRRNVVAEELQRDAIAAYLPTLARTDWPLIRVGRFVFEGACAPCHGAYGQGEGVLGATNDPPPPDLMRTRERYTDPALTRLVVEGFGTMPALGAVFAPGELRAAIAYVRHLSKGYRLYDTYCASCHGDDGLGVHPEDRLPPSIPAPPLDAAALTRLGPAKLRERTLHMLQRESGRMPHFRDTLEEAELRAIIAWLRASTPPS